MQGFCGKFSKKMLSRNEKESKGINSVQICRNSLQIRRRFLRDGYGIRSGWGATPAMAKYRKAHVPTNIANKLVTLPYGKERNRTFAHRARQNAHGYTNRAEKHQKHARNHLHNPRMPRSRSLHLSQIAKKPANRI